MKKLKKLLFFSLLAIGLIAISILTLNTISPKHALALTPASEPQLVLFLAASSSTPFNDLSLARHDVQLVGNVNTTDSELGRKVYAFDGGHLKVGRLESGQITDSLNSLLDYRSTQSMTIEICIKVTNLNQTQVIMDKGNLPSGSEYSRNYGFVYAPDPLEFPSENPAWFSPISFFSGQITYGIVSPDQRFIDWKIYAIRIWPENEKLWWQRFIDGQNYDGPPWDPRKHDWTPYKIQIDSNNNDDPLHVGTGYTTGIFETRPFYGLIDYIKIWKGLVPINELNINPYGPIPGLPQNRAPVAQCKDFPEPIYLNSECQATIDPDHIDNGSYDPDGDAISLIVTPSTVSMPGTYSVILTVTDSSGGSSFCTTNVTVDDNIPPVISFTGPVCVNDDKGKMVNKITVSAADNCSGAVAPQISDVKIYNQSGNVVNGKGISEIIRNTILVNPNGNGWSLTFTVMANDIYGNKSTKTITNLPLLQCKK